MVRNAPIKWTVFAKEGILYRSRCVAPLFNNTALDYLNRASGIMVYIGHALKFEYGYDELVED